MKPGLRAGLEEVLYVQVTPEMVVEFGGKPLHPFYPTYWACHHAEYVCRLLLEPFLEPDEDGIGSGLFIHHHSPALVGQHLKLTATSTRVREHHLACRFEITDGNRRIAHGNVHQVVLPRQRVREMHERAALRSNSK
jgi:fluoroacetyl-CoA thioesterase